MENNIADLDNQNTPIFKFTETPPVEMWAKISSIGELTLFDAAACERAAKRGDTYAVLALKLIAAESDRCARLCEWLPYGTGFEGKTFAEAIRGVGMGGKMARGFEVQIGRRVKMTDRYHTLTVVLEKDVRIDDAQALIAAIMQMRGVLKVAGLVADTTDYMAEERARRALGEKLLEVLYPKTNLDVK